MNCKEFQALAVELARRFPSDSAEADALLHVTDCAACRMRLAEERILTLRLHQASESVYSCKIPAQIDVAVFRAFEEHRKKLAGAANRPVTRAKQAWIAGSVAAAAAAALLLFAMTDARMAKTPQFSPADLSVSVRETAPIEAGGNKVSELVNSPEEEPSGIIGNPAAGPTVVVETPPPITTSAEPDLLNAENQTPVSNGAEFVPIPLGVNPMWRQTGPIVRVEVSGAVLDLMGFPISGDLYGRRIQADLMLGDDGMARAIRFVR